MMLFISSYLVLPLKGNMPNSIWYNMTPIAQTSTDEFTFFNLSLRISGAIYISDPILTLSVFAMQANPAIPKSITLIWSLSYDTTRIFSNFKSLCISFLTWQYETASAIWTKYPIAASSENLVFSLKRSVNSPPSKYSITTAT